MDEHQKLSQEFDDCIKEAEAATLAGNMEEARQCALDALNAFKLMMEIKYGSD